MRTTKRYLTEIDLSAFTTTDDLEGPREEVTVTVPPRLDRVRAAIARFAGTIRQRPPAFSAVKIGGRRAYKLARRGGAPSLEERNVTVHRLELVRYDWPLIEVDLTCDKGFYVRSFARDLGHALGTGGHCRSIRRTAVGPFSDQTAVPLDRVPDPLRAGDLLTAEEALRMVGASQGPTGPPTASSPLPGR
jgi:tRNA pseudouridine55 synthase